MKVLFYIFALFLFLGLAFFSGFLTLFTATVSELNSSFFPYMPTSVKAIYGLLIGALTLGFAFIFAKS